MSKSIIDNRIFLIIKVIDINSSLKIVYIIKLYNIFCTTLRDKIIDRTFISDNRNVCYKLTSKEKNIIIKYIFNLNSREFSSRSQRVEDIVNLLLAICTTQHVDKN